MTERAHGARGARTRPRHRGLAWLRRERGGAADHLATCARPLPGAFRNGADPRTFTGASAIEHVPARMPGVIARTRGGVAACVLSMTAATTGFLVPVDAPADPFTLAEATSP